MIQTRTRLCALNSYPGNAQEEAPFIHFLIDQLRTDEIHPVLAVAVPNSAFRDLIGKPGIFERLPRGKISDSPGVVVMFEVLPPDATFFTTATLGGDMFVRDMGVTDSGNIYAVWSRSFGMKSVCVANSKIQELSQELTTDMTADIVPMSFYNMRKGTLLH